jgi:hypothetical protein
MWPDACWELDYGLCIRRRSFRIRSSRGGDEMLDGSVDARTGAVSEDARIAS